MTKLQRMMLRSLSFRSVLFVTLWMCVLFLHRHVHVYAKSARVCCLCMFAVFHDDEAQTQHSKVVRLKSVTLDVGGADQV